MSGTLHMEIASIDKCAHTRHRHGWWCVRCLRAAAPSIVVTHCGRGKWTATVGPVDGFGTRRVHAMQACIERCEMDGVPMREVQS